MRFVLNDPAKADVAKIEALKSAKGTFTQAGQFQVIIGNTVSDFYNDFIAVSGIDGVSKDAVKSAAKQNQNALQKVMSVLAEIFAPLIPAIVYAGISGSFRVVFGAIFGFVYAPLVITGLHHMSNAIDMQLIADFGGTMLWPMIALSNIAQGSAVLGMIYLQRKNAAAQEVNVPSCISCYLGVTEPAMFGVNLKFHFPFICGMIGSAIAAVVCVATSTTANAIGVGGIPGILSIQPAYMLSFALCMAIAIVVPFVLTVIVGKKKGVA
jgi:glucose-like phosphotransferase system IIB component